MPGPSADYRLTPEAERDLEAIWTYTFEQWDLEQAHDYVGRLIAAFEALTANPQRGQRVDHIRAGYRRRTVGRHAIYYRQTGYGVAVIRVLHDRMLPAQHLSESNTDE